MVALKIISISSPTFTLVSESWTSHVAGVSIWACRKKGRRKIRISGSLLRIRFIVSKGAKITNLQAKKLASP
jgi:hypothetical protein